MKQMWFDSRSIILPSFILDIVLPSTAVPKITFAFLPVSFYIASQNPYLRFLSEHYSSCVIVTILIIQYILKE